MTWGRKTSTPENHEDEERPQVRDVLDGCELAMVVYRIDNGYLLRIGGTLGLASALIFCADEQDMATKIVAHRAKQKIMGVQTSPHPRYGMSVTQAYALTKGETITLVGPGTFSVSAD